MNDLDLLDSALDNLVAQAELEGATCALKHSKFDPSGNHPAVNYLCQGVGDTETKVTEYAVRIPICEECMEALYNEDWILVYCINCNKSQWIYRPLAKRGHQGGNIIYWLDVCPHCAEIANKYKED